MTRSFVYKTGSSAGDVSFNMTPLIDCTFLLLIFFVLTSQMSSDSLANLDLPRPLASVAAPAAHRHSGPLIVNVISAEGDDGLVGADRIGQAAGYKIEGRFVQVGDVDTLVAILRTHRTDTAGDLLLEVRADRRVQFGHVQPVMDAATAAGISKVDLTALLESPGAS